MNRLEIENDWLDSAANWLDNPAPFYLGADTTIYATDTRINLRVGRAINNLRQARGL